MSFKVIDIVFAVILLIMGIFGLKKGFFTQLITIIGILAGLFLAYFFSDDLSVLIAKIIGDKDYNNLLSFILIFTVIILLSMLLNKVFDKALEELGGEGLDRILGLTFGLVQGMIICIILTSFLAVQPFFDPDNIFDGSVLGNWFLTVLPQIEKLIPNAQELLTEMEIKV